MRIPDASYNLFQGCITGGGDFIEGLIGTLGSVLIIGTTYDCGQYKLLEFGDAPHVP